MASSIQRHVNDDNCRVYKVLQSVRTRNVGIGAATNVSEGVLDSGDSARAATREATLELHLAVETLVATDWRGGRRPRGPECVRRPDRRRGGRVPPADATSTRLHLHLHLHLHLQRHLVPVRRRHVAGSRGRTATAAGTRVGVAQDAAAAAARRRALVAQARGDREARQQARRRKCVRVERLLAPIAVGLRSGREQRHVRAVAGAVTAAVERRLAAIRERLLLLLLLLELLLRHGNTIELTIDRLQLRWLRVLVQVLHRRVRIGHRRLRQPVIRRLLLHLLLLLLLLLLHLLLHLLLLLLLLLLHLLLHLLLLLLLLHLLLLLLLLQHLLLHLLLLLLLLHLLLLLLVVREVFDLVELQLGAQRDAGAERAAAGPEGGQVLHAARSGRVGQRRGGGGWRAGQRRAVLAARAEHRDVAPERGAHQRVVRRELGVVAIEQRGRRVLHTHASQRVAARLACRSSTWRRIVRTK